MAPRGRGTVLFCSAAGAGGAPVSWQGRFWVKRCLNTLLRVCPLTSQLRGANQDGLRELAGTSSGSVFLKHVNICTSGDCLTPGRFTPVCTMEVKHNPRASPRGGQGSSPIRELDPRVGGTQAVPDGQASRRGLAGGSAAGKGPREWSFISELLLLWAL